jgi:hypothetical protein
MALERKKEKKKDLAKPIKCCHNQAKNGLRKRYIKGQISKQLKLFCLKKSKRPMLPCSVPHVIKLFADVPYFIEYNAHFFTLKMMLKYSLGTIQGR